MIARPRPRNRSSSSSSMVITEAQVAGDLARLPPPLPSSSLLNEKAAVAARELALVLVYQQSRALLRMGEGDQAQLAQLSAELRLSSAACPTSIPAAVATAINKGFRMADALEEEEEEDVDKETYKRVLRAHKALPVALQLQCGEIVRLSPAARGQSGGGGGGGGDGSEHQLMRDVERDQLMLYGCPYRAGAGGYARVLHWLRSAMEARLERVLPPGGANAKQLEAFAKEMLRRINRTHSAGVSYDRLSHALGVEGVTNIVPDSASAEPLSIQLEVGAFPLPAATSDDNLMKKQKQPHSPSRSPQRRKEQEEQEGAQADDSGGDWTWGLRARLRTATVYDVYDDAVEEKWLRVRVEFEETLCLTLVAVGAARAPAAAASCVSLDASIRMTERQA